MIHKIDKSDQVESHYEDLIGPAKAPGPFDLHYLLPRLLARWHWILIGTLLGIVIGIISIRLATPQYRATASVLVKDQNDTLLGGADSSDLDLRNSQSIESIRAGFNQSALYETIAADDTIRSLPNLVPPPPRGISSLFKLPKQQETAMLDEAPPLQQLAGMIHGWTFTQARRGTRFIDITVNHTNQDVAQVIANKIVDYYIERRKDDKSSGFQEDIDALNKERDRVKKELQTAQKNLAAYTKALAAENSLTESEKMLIDLRGRYKHKHPTLKAAVARAETEKMRLINELQQISGGDLDSETWKEHQSYFENLEDPDSLAKLRTLLNVRVSVLETEIKTQDTTYQSLHDRTETKEVTKESAEAEVNFTDQARRPAVAYSPNRKSIMVKNTVLGLFAGLAVAFAFQYFDNKFHGVQEVEQAFGASVLSAIQKLPPEEELAADKQLLLHLPPSMRRISPTLAVPGFKPDCVHSEMFRVLRASMSLLGDAHNRKVTLISSSLPGEGKTFVAANLAIAYAKQGTRTLIVDLDLRKPALHKIFGEGRADRPGIVNVMNGTAAASQAVVKYAGLDNLSVIFSGPQTPSPGELLEPGRLRSLINMFAANFDHVIIDSAPLLPVPDTRIIAPMVHNFGLVARADHTPRKAVQATLELLADDGIRPSGIILNDFTEQRLQGGKYGYGYGYGSYGEEKEEI